ncbi:hypothetical protein [Methanobacterium sp.]|uniref:hypothetical protein n=1 Tax=Methanobacterium sp. TaxID=2164 RepID=UPI003C70CE4E
MKSGIAVLGILSILLVVVSVSGCIGNEKTLYQYNLTGHAPTYIGVQNVTIPNGTKTVKIEAQNLTKVNTNLNPSTVTVYALSTVPVTITATNNETAIIKSYNSSIITQQSMNLTNETTPQTLNFTFNEATIKGLLIINYNSKGTIQIITS